MTAIGPLPILRDTLTLFVYVDESFCHRAFIYSNVHWQLVTLLHDGSLYFVCLLAESYETINQSINNCPYKIQLWIILFCRCTIHVARNAWTIWRSEERWGLSNANQSCIWSMCCELSEKLSGNSCKPHQQLFFCFIFRQWKNQMQVDNIEFFETFLISELSHLCKNRFCLWVCVDQNLWNKRWLLWEIFKATRARIEIA